MNSSPPDVHNAHSEVTSLLAQLGDHNGEAESRLIQLIYDDLRRIARHRLRSERPNHTLQPTALVNEAYLRLVDGPQRQWQNKAHFFATASRLMRHILVDHARKKDAEKRGGARLQVTLSEVLLESKPLSIDLLALDNALDELGRLDARQAKIVELHCFGGLVFEEIALLLGVSDRTIIRDWDMAKAWLKCELSGKA